MTKEQVEVIEINENNYHEYFEKLDEYKWKNISFEINDDKIDSWKLFEILIIRSNKSLNLKLIKNLLINFDISFKIDNILKEKIIIDYSNEIKSNIYVFNFNNIDFIGCLNIEWFYVNLLNIKAKNFYFSNIETDKPISVNIKSCKFKVFQIFSVNFNRLVFEDCVFELLLNFTCISTHTLNIFYSSFKEFYIFDFNFNTLNLSNILEWNILNIYWCNYTKPNLNSISRIHLWPNFNVTQTSIDNSKDLSIVMLNKNEYDNEKLSLKPNYLGEFIFNEIENINVKLCFENLNTDFIKKIEIKNIIFNKENILMMSWLNIDYLFITNVKIISESSSLNNIIINKKFFINNVNFWKTLFNALYFNKKCYKYIRFPVFNDCIFNTVDWNNYKFEYSDLIWDTFSNNKIEQKDVYRQLKYVMDKNNNYLEWNKFYELEMKEYLKELKEWKWYENLGKKIILYFEWLVTNFWNSWIQWVGILLVFILIINSLIWIYLKYLISSWFVINLDFWSTYIYLLQPFSWLEYTTKANDFLNIFWSLKNLAIFWFIWYKVIYWIIVYQIWVALKRQTKR